ncbi:MAG: hypothetical protein ACR2M6_01150 [Vampirovibrionia bacterium]|jgi:hypothetical protein
MKLKLSPIALFIIVIIALVLGMLCNSVVEGLANKDENKKSASDANPKGVPKSQIPHGDEDLYILKSQIVPPVCPACPTNTSCPREKPAPPCPPCARCPEPAFDCKKVPNYQSNNEQYLPKPMLTNFSSF